MKNKEKVRVRKRPKQKNRMTPGIRTVFILMLIFAIILLSGLVVYVNGILENTFTSLLRGDAIFSDPIASIVVICLALMVVFLSFFIIYILTTNKGKLDPENEPSSVKVKRGYASGKGGGRHDSSVAQRKQGRNRFYKLNEVDEKMKKYATPEAEKGLTLEEMCERFRNFAATRGLYYDINVIRSFIASLSVTRLIIMQGISGTGKTSLACVFGEFIENKSTVVSVQPFWKESSDLLGYFNEFTNTFNETELLRVIYEANYSKEIYVTVLDEMNIARVEYYFADFLSKLELPDIESRRIAVVSDRWEDDPVLLYNGSVQLPPNMWYIGTANNDDSTLAISDKVYDRAMIIDLNMRAKPFEPDRERSASVAINYGAFELMAKQARDTYAISERTLEAIGELDTYLIEKLKITFGNRIMEQIKRYVPVYIACGGKELDAVDGIIAKKILRKLESKNPMFLKSISGELSDKLDEIFGKDTMPVCKDCLERLIFA